MRVVPAPGLVLRDPRTRRFVDPDLGVDVPDTDLTFAWLLAHGDCALLSDADYAAALAKREADQKAASAAEAAPVAAQAGPPAVSATAADAKGDAA